VTSAITSSGGVSVSGNVATLTIDESTLGTSDDTVTVGLTLDDVDASGASAGTVGYSVVPDGGPDFTGESVNAPFDIGEGYDPANPYQGEDVTFTNDEITDGDEYDLRRVTGTNDSSVTNSQFVDTVVAEQGNSISFDTESLEADDYFVTGDNIDSQPSLSDTFEVRIQQLSTEFDEDSVQSDENGTLEIDSNRGTYSLNVSADGDLDDEQLEELFNEDFNVNADSVGDDDDDEIQLTGISDGEYNTNFSNVSDLNTGNYEFTFEAPDTSAEDTASIEVTEAGEGELELAEGSYDVAQGDVSEITVELNEVTEGTVVIGNEEDDNYQANISIVDDDEDGEVVLNFNTFTAGNTTEGVTVVSAEGDDMATLENQGSDAQELNSLLDTGDYDISVSPTALTGPENDNAADALDDESDIGSLIISERSTDDMQLWRTTADVRDDVVDVQSDENASAAVGAITSGVEDGVVTETDTAALGETDDVIVHQISASGLEGALESVDDDYSVALEGLADNDDIALNFTEENPGANQEAEEFQLGAGEDVTADDLDVVYDDANGDYYVFLSAGDISSDIEDGDEYEVDFTVKNEELIDSDDEDDWQTVNSTIGFEDAEISFDLNDDDEVEVENAENQSITGTTNVAPGRTSTSASAARTQRRTSSRTLRTTLSRLTACSPASSTSVRRA